MESGGLVSPTSMIINLVKDRHCAARLCERLPVRRLPAHDPAGRRHEETPNVALDFVLEIDVPDGDIIERMSGRRAARRELAHLPRVKLQPAQGRRRGRRDRRAPDPARRRPGSRPLKSGWTSTLAQTRPLVDYYSGWAASGDAQAPRYRRIDGSGTVEQITARAFAALA
jgi:adenylate kinase